MCAAAASNQLVRYDNTALAASALQSDMVVRGRTELKKIYQILPPGATAVVQFVVTANDVSSAAAVYHAATAHFEVSADRKLKVTATIASYADGAYQTQKKLTASGSEESNDAREQEEKAVVKATDKKTEVVVRRHPLLREQHKKNYSEMGAQARANEAHQIMLHINEMFKEGVPLPGDQRFESCSFVVSVNLPGKSIQRLIASGGLDWGGTGVDEAYLNDKDNRKIINRWDPAYREWCRDALEQSRDRLLRSHTELQQVARGERRPNAVPAEARQVSGGTGVLALEAPSSAEAALPPPAAARVPQIEEVLD